LGQDDYYYEIQLTNKQLVFYFLAGSAALVLSFLAGVKVGRGVEETASADAGVRRVVEDRIVPEEPAARAPAAEELTYAQRLESDKVEESLERPAGEAGPTAGAPKAPEAKPAPTPRPAATAAPKPSPPPPSAAKATPAPAAKPPAAAAAAGTFTIQVGAFKDKTTAESIAARLKAKGYDAYVVAPDGPEGGLFNVRVGTYPARADAERAQAKLRDEEKYKPFIVKN
jgi:cell division septation protein DedD